MPKKQSLHASAGQDLLMTPNAKFTASESRTGGGVRSAQAATISSVKVVPAVARAAPR